MEEKIDVEQVKILLLENAYPFFDDDDLEEMAKLYTNINELCYVACLMKADAQEVTVGPITVKSNANMWLKMADMFYKRWQDDLISNGVKRRSITGTIGGRADEY